jgi:hypothetical protein
MFKNKVYAYSFIGVLILCFMLVSRANIQAADTLPDNVKISSTPNSYQVFITDKPGYNTQVTTTCTNGQCTNSATSTPITQAEIQKMQDEASAQQTALERLFAQQEALFQAQEQYFQSFWNTVN